MLCSKGDIVSLTYAFFLFDDFIQSQAEFHKILMLHTAGQKQAKEKAVVATMNPLESFLVDLKLSASQSGALDLSMAEDGETMDVTIVSDNARMPSQELSESFSSLSFSCGNNEPS